MLTFCINSTRGRGGHGSPRWIGERRLLLSWAKAGKRHLERLGFRLDFFRALAVRGSRFLLLTMEEGTFDLSADSVESDNDDPYARLILDGWVLGIGYAAI